MASGTPYAHAVRKLILDQSKRAHVGHVGSSMAIADIVTLLYDRLLKGQDPDDRDRDRVVLSKGHAALALYAALALNGHITATDLDSYCGDDSLLGVHPEPELKGVDFGTGSHGQALSTSRPAHRTCCSRALTLAAASPTCAARSSGITCRCRTTTTRPRWPISRRSKNEGDLRQHPERHRQAGRADRAAHRRSWLHGAGAVSRGS